MERGDAPANTVYPGTCHETSGLYVGFSGLASPLRGSWQQKFVAMGHANCAG
jgi:hypothetical protein